MHNLPVRIQIAGTLKRKAQRNVRGETVAIAAFVYQLLR